MTTNELIKALRDWADGMAMPGRRQLVNEAADRLEELEERIAIMEEGNQITIAPGANVDLTAILDSIEKKEQRAHRGGIECRNFP